MVDLDTVFFVMKVKDVKKQKKQICTYFKTL